MDFISIEVFTNPRKVRAYGYMDVHARYLCGADSFTSILSSLASIPAERLLRPHRSAFYMVLTSCKDDWEQSVKQCERLGLGIEKCLKDAGRLVRRLAPSIYRIAKTLEEKKLLSYEDVLKLCPEAVAEGMACSASLMFQQRQAAASQ